WQITEEQICKILKVDSINKIGADQIVILRGLATALQDGEITVDQALRGSKPIPTMPKPTRGKKAKKARNPKAQASHGVQVAEATDSTKKPSPTVKPVADAATSKTITNNQFLDLQSWLGEHRVEMTTVAKIAKSLGHAGKVKD